MHGNSCDVDLSGNLFIGTTGHGFILSISTTFSVTSSDPLGNSLKRPKFN